MTTPTVAIIIPVRNRADEMRRLLSSIAAQTYPADAIETVVVDAFSTDATAAVCRSFPFVKFIPLQAERHISRNHGIKLTQTKYLMQIDSDMEFVPDTVATLIRIAETEGYEVLSIPERSTGTTLWAKARALEKIMIDDDLDRCGARFMTRKAFDTVGGYDEEILHSEDYNLHTRLIAAGFKHRVAKETFLFHHEGCSIWQAARKQFYYSQTAHLYIKKFPGASWRQYNPFRKAYLTHAGLLLRHPFLTCVLFGGKALTYITGGAGLCYGLWKTPSNNKPHK